MTVSFEISREHIDKWPPFSDACETCFGSEFDGAVVPHATFTQGDRLVALYHHGRCGKEWYTTWSARYDSAWQRVGAGSGTPTPLGGRGVLRALPASGRSAS